MKKKGYTLAESLIALGIVGVVAALMLPLMNKYKPDGDKALFIRTYDSIVEATSSMVSDKEIYRHEVSIPNDPQGCVVADHNCNYWDYSRAPLLDDKEIILLDNTKIEASNSVEKYCNALAYHMHTTDKCSGTGGNFGLKLINNIDVNVIKQPSKNFFELTIELPSGEKFYLDVLPNGKVIPASYSSDNGRSLLYILTRSNWRKGATLEPKKLAQENKNYDDIRNYYKDKAKPIKRNPAGEYIPTAQ